MLSIGIRFGQGFDKMSALKMLQTIPLEYNYDLIVIGTSPGGIACAREARLAGKKTAVIRWNEYSPAEKDGFDENMREMAEALDIEEDYISSSKNLLESRGSAGFVLSNENHKHNSAKSVHNSGSTLPSESPSRRRDTIKSLRKVRQSRLDLNNELFKRGKECVKIMQNAAALGDVVENAFHSGWRLCTTRPPLSMNWHKMTEEIMDHVMKKNYDLMNDLSNEGVEIITGRPVFFDNHTVKIIGMPDELSITSDLICIAPAAHYEFPKDVEGSEEFGINFDDFPRLSEPPGKTLIVGGTSEALECAGILACCRFPVTIVSRKNILEGYDSEITQMITLSLKKKGVKLMENITLKSITMLNDNHLLATFAPPEKESEDENKQGDENFQESDTFDTVLFAVRKSVNLEKLGLDFTEVELEPESGKIRTNSLEATTAPNIYAIGEAVYGASDCPEVSELAGKLLGRRLFHNEEQLMDHSFYPEVIYTPIEYAFVGLSEDSAFYRFGLYCIDVYHGFFQPLDFVLPPIQEKCFAKVIVFKSTNRIVGMHILGPRAGDIIQGFAAGLRNELTMKNLQTIVGVPASNAQEFLKLKELKTFEEKVLSPSQLIFGVSK